MFNNMVHLWENEAGAHNEGDVYLEGLTGPCGTELFELMTSVKNLIKGPCNAARPDLKASILTLFSRLSCELIDSVYTEVLVKVICENVSV